MRKRNGLLVTAGLVVLLVGGGVVWAIATRQPGKYPVRGTVTAADGKPAVGAVVMFHPAGAKTEKAIVGGADDKGEFVMTTDQPGDGVLAGEYTVTVVWTPPRKPPGEAMAEAMKTGKAPAGMPAMPPFLKKLLGDGPPDQEKMQKLLANGPPKGMAPPQGMPNMLDQKDKLNGKYADPLRSQITFTVTSGENVVPPIVLK
jgi:hypothetical protein